MNLSDIAQCFQQPFSGTDLSINQFEIDSRKTQLNDVFVAFKGERVDGHDYIIQAIENGAKAIIYSDELPDGIASDIACFKVQDCQKALAKLAAFWRNQFDVPVVAITGSTGKTTVKGMLHAICLQQGPTLATQGNYNNEIGLPLTLLRLEKQHQFVILEMGAGKPHDIGYLCKIASPSIAMVNNIFPAHVEYFGSLQNIAETKSEIYQGLPYDGTAILNEDIAFKDYFRNRIDGRRVITFSMKDIRSAVYAKNIRLVDNKMQFELLVKNEQVLVNLPMLGEHNVNNALAASALALALGLPITVIQAGLESYRGQASRLIQIKGLNGANIIDDSYNANPGSVNAALKVLSELDGQKICVLGDMAELGNNAAEYHQEMGLKAKQYGIDKLFVIGAYGRAMQSGFGEHAYVFENKQDLVNAIKAHLAPDAHILVKGSRASKMEDIIQHLI